MIRLALLLLTCSAPPLQGDLPCTSPDCPPWIWPLSGDVYQPRRLLNTHGQLVRILDGAEPQSHRGIDIGAGAANGAGETVRAVADGMVVAIQYQGPGSFQNRVMIAPEAETTWALAYVHLAEVHYAIENFEAPETVLQQPPKHVDHLPELGGIVDVSMRDDYFAEFVQTDTASGSILRKNKTDWSIGAKAGIGFGEPTPQDKFARRAEQRIVEAVEQLVRLVRDAIVRVERDPHHVGLERHGRGRSEAGRVPDQVSDDAVRQVERGIGRAVVLILSRSIQGLPGGETSHEVFEWRPPQPGRRMLYVCYVSPGTRIAPTLQLPVIIGEPGDSDDATLQQP